MIDMGVLFVKQFTLKPNCRLQKYPSHSKKLFSLLSIIFSIILLTLDQKRLVYSCYIEFLIHF